MDKEVDELREDIRRTLQAINDNLLELNDYLTRLRRETVAEINEAMRTGNEVSDQELRATLFAEYPTLIETLDTRLPYQNQRQPRRDGDSYGSVTPLKDAGGADGTKTTDPGE